MRGEWYQKFRQLRTRFLEEIKGVLDPEQDKKFDDMIEWYDEQRRLELERRRRHAEEEKKDEGESR
jgi:hypothetical protein